jgi:hypothetical protein
MKKNFYAFIFSFLLLVCLLLFIKNDTIQDYYNYIKNGSASFLNNNKYDHSTYIFDNDVKFKLNLKHLYEFNDKNIYEDELNYIKVNSVEEVDNNIQLSIDLNSKYNFNGGKMIRHKDDTDNNILQYDIKIEAVFTNEDKFYGVIKGVGYTKDGVNLLILIGDSSENMDLSNFDTVEITLSNFIINDYRRL